MFLKIVIFLLIINKIISDDSNSEDNGNENSNSKPSDEFADSVDVREVKIINYLTEQNYYILYTIQIIQCHSKLKI